MGEASTPLKVFINNGVVGVGDTFWVIGPRGVEARTVESLKVVRFSVIILTTHGGLTAGHGALECYATEKDAKAEQMRQAKEVVKVAKTALAEAEAKLATLKKR